MHYATWVSRGKTHHFHHTTSGFTVLVFTFTFRALVCNATLPTIWPYIRFLFVGSLALLHRFLPPHGITASGLRFATLGGKYLWQDFHLQETCHARHTLREPRQYTWALCCQDLSGRSGLLKVCKRTLYVSLRICL